MRRFVTGAVSLVQRFGSSLALNIHLHALLLGGVRVASDAAAAADIVLITLEDETGTTNLVVHPKIYERYRAAARHGVMLQVTGKVDRAGSVVHVVCWRIETVDGEAAGIRRGSRDFH